MSLDNVIMIDSPAGPFKFDPEDWLRLQHLPWRFAWVGSRPSLTRQISQSGSRINIYIYHDILGITPSLERPVDHINRDLLDNRRCNLRIATPCLNAANRPPKSGYKGVSKKGADRFVARIKDGPKVRTLGSFKSPHEAALAYDRAAIKAWGEFAWLNMEHFPELAFRGAISNA